MNFEKWAAIVTIIGFPILIGSLIFAFKLDGKISTQLTELKQIATSQNNIALNTMIFNDPDNIGIISDMENNHPILVAHGGRYTSTQLDKYLGDFDTVDFAYQEGLLSQDQLCDSFSSYLEEIASSTEAQAYMSADPADYGGQFGLRGLTQIVEHSKSSFCN